eukprot:TRINITY_DN14265_c0_g2_i3.p1 TRINITY_DN14265_c0_g2~~TRINITY_DN14265_c0_g2_i3.p1  ORF type:complete len:1121 (-),score=349.93 TRINITY_DN14265_c0_g2_i3:40-3402(-)
MRETRQKRAQQPSLCSDGPKVFPYSPDDLAAQERRAKTLAATAAKPPTTTSQTARRLAKETAAPAATAPGVRPARHRALAAAKAPAGSTGVSAQSSAAAGWVDEHLTTNSLAHAAEEAMETRERASAVGAAAAAATDVDSAADLPPNVDNRAQVFAAVNAVSASVNALRAAVGAQYDDDDLEAAEALPGEVASEESPRHKKKKYDSLFTEFNDLRAVVDVMLAHVGARKNEENEDGEEEAAEQAGAGPTESSGEPAGPAAEAGGGKGLARIPVTFRKHVAPKVFPPPPRPVIKVDSPIGSDVDDQNDFDEQYDPGDDASVNEEMYMDDPEPESGKPPPAQQQHIAEDEEYNISEATEDIAGLMKKLHNSKRYELLGELVHRGGIRLGISEEEQKKLELDESELDTAVSEFMNSWETMQDRTKAYEGEVCHQLASYYRKIRGTREQVRNKIKEARAKAAGKNWMIFNEDTETAQEKAEARKRELEHLKDGLLGQDEDGSESEDDGAGRRPPLKDAAVKPSDLLELVALCQEESVNKKLEISRLEKQAKAYTAAIEALHVSRRTDLVPEDKAILETIMEVEETRRDKMRLEGLMGPIPSDWKEAARLQKAQREVKVLIRNYEQKVADKGDVSLTDTGPGYSIPALISKLHKTLLSKGATEDDVIDYTILDEGASRRLASTCKALTAKVEDVRKHLKILRDLEVAASADAVPAAEENVQALVDTAGRFSEGGDVAEARQETNMLDALLEQGEERGDLAGRPRASSSSAAGGQSEATSDVVAANDAEAEAQKALLAAMAAEEEAEAAGVAAAAAANAAEGEDSQRGHVETEKDARQEKAARLIQKAYRATRLYQGRRGAMEMQRLDGEDMVLYQARRRADDLEQQVAEAEERLAQRQLELVAQETEASSELELQRQSSGDGDEELELKAGRRKMEVLRLKRIWEAVNKKLRLGGGLDALVGAGGGLTELGNEVNDLVREALEKAKELPRTSSDAAATSPSPDAAATTSPTPEVKEATSPSPGPSSGDRKRPPALTNASSSKGPSPPATPTPQELKASDPKSPKSFGKSKSAAKPSAGTSAGGRASPMSSPTPPPQEAGKASEPSSPKSPASPGGTRRKRKSVKK